MKKSLSMLIIIAMPTLAVGKDPDYLNQFSIAKCITVEYVCGTEQRTMHVPRKDENGNTYYEDVIYDVEKKCTRSSCE